MFFYIQYFLFVHLGVIYVSEHVHLNLLHVMGNTRETTVNLNTYSFHIFYSTLLRVVKKIELPVKSEYVTL